MANDFKQELKSKQRRARQKKLRSFEGYKLKELRTGETPPYLAYAYRKTGRILTNDNIGSVSLDTLREWYAAVREYFAQERAAKRGPHSSAYH